MGKESRVEIPSGSGNFYRYEYSDGATRYLGPVGDAPSLSEEEFTRSMLVWEVREQLGSLPTVDAHGNFHDMETGRLYDITTDEGTERWFDLGQTRTDAAHKLRADLDAMEMLVDEAYNRYFLAWYVHSGFGLRYYPKEGWELPAKGMLDIHDLYDLDRHDEADAMRKELDQKVKEIHALTRKDYGDEYGGNWLRTISLPDIDELSNFTLVDSYHVWADDVHDGRWREVMPPPGFVEPRP